MNLCRTIVITLLAVMLFGSCMREETAPPNIVLFLADDLSFRDLGCTGNNVVHTPNVDKLASEGLQMTGMFTPTAMCAPARSALYTGLFPHRNGCHMNWGAVKEGTLSLPHYLQPLGYRVALVEKVHVNPREAFPFDYMKADSMENYLKSVGNQPFCMIYASHEPHGPHREGRITAEDVSSPVNWPDTWESRDLHARYLNDVEAMDREFGELVDMLERNSLLENTVVIFTSDHGHEFFAKWSCYDEGIHIPFIVKWDGVLGKGTRNPAFTSLVDLLPTFTEMAGGVAPENIDGKSFLQVLKADKKEHRSYIYSAHTNRGIISGSAYPIRGVRSERYKYIENLNSEAMFQNKNTHGWEWDTAAAEQIWKSWLHLAETDPSATARVKFYRKRPAEELYDLQNDPFELNNLAASEAYDSTRVRLRSELYGWMEQQGDRGLEAELEIPLWNDGLPGKRKSN
ncbi:MAG: sulfatase [Bacteroidota bacterium]